ncbi:hypothetical protein [Nibribacter koreensis]|uniref:Uncharacterized protein n=1 Tax=Nibribacter koreensis TaxID=1084519 RepID=A0ABP8FYP3_9BACT
MEATEVTLWFYFRSASPVYTCTLNKLDAKLESVLEDVRLVRHGNHVFVHLRSEFEWERAMQILGQPVKLVEDSAA